MMDDNKQTNKAIYEIEERLLDEFYNVFGNLQSLHCIVEALANDLRDKEKSIEIFYALEYFLRCSLDDFGKSISEFDMLVLRKK